MPFPRRFGRHCVEPDPPSGRITRSATGVPSKSPKRSSFTPYPVEEAEEKVAHRRVLPGEAVPAGLDRAAAVAGQYDGKIRVAVMIGVGEAAAPDDHRIVKDGFAVRILSRLGCSRK